MTTQATSGSDRVRLRLHLSRRFHLQALTCLALAVVVGFPVGCSKPAAPIVQSEPLENPLPRFLRGTVRYEAHLEGYAPNFVQGFGLVVGLNGTGSNDTPIPVRRYLEREAQKMMHDTRPGTEPGLDLRSLLDSRDTAAVIVQAAIPPGALKGTRFDVLVGTVPGTSTTSLEGGRLWTVFLRSIHEDPYGPESAALAQAAGDLFINPFAPPAVDPLRRDWLLGGEEEEGSEGAPMTHAYEGALFDRRAGRVLNGGITTQDMPLALFLRTASFSRSRAIADAINARFPRESGQRRETAEPVLGRTDELIAVSVPPSWRDRTEIFVEVLMHTQIFQAGIEQRSAQLARWLVENPIDARDVSWCLVALGELAVPAFSHLYTYPELIPRLAALNAGARLGDPLVVPHLIDIAFDTDHALRVDVVRLLGEMPPSPRIGLALRDLVDDEEFEVRIAAFEALLTQGDPLVRRATLDPRQEFELFTLPAREPFIYATQQGKPRIVVFGDEIEVRRPSMVSGWADRFLLVSDGPDDPLRVLYRRRPKEEGTAFEAPADMVRFISFLGAKPSPFARDPALGMTYAETIRTLFAMHKEEALPAPFVAEQDILTERILTGRRQAVPPQRPETGDAEKIQPWELER